MNRTPVSDTQQCEVRVLPLDEFPDLRIVAWKIGAARRRLRNCETEARRCCAEHRSPLSSEWAPLLQRRTFIASRLNRSRSCGDWSMTMHVPECKDAADAESDASAAFHERTVVLYCRPGVPAVRSHVILSALASECSTGLSSLYAHRLARLQPGTSQAFDTMSEGRSSAAEALKIRLACQARAEKQLRIHRTVACQQASKSSLG